MTLDELGQVRRWDLDTQSEDAANRRDLPGGRSTQVRVLSPNGRLAAIAEEIRCMFLTQPRAKRSSRLIPPITRHLIFSRSNDWLVIVDDKIRWLGASGEVIAVENSDSTGQQAGPCLPTV